MTQVVMTGVGALETRPVPHPAPGPGEVVLDMRSIGICGSDAAYLHRGRIASWIVEPPFVLGHEAAGVIVEVGSGVPSARIGQRVAVEPGRPCRTCAQCTRGSYHLCPDLVFLATPPYDGCLADRIVMDASCAHPIPDSMSFDDAALVEPASVGLWACRRAQLQAGERVHVTGAGPVGILSALVARALGAGLITVSDPSAQRRETARACGLRAEDPQEAGPVAPAADVDVLIECSGHPEALASGLHRLAPGGRAALVGMPHSDSLELPLPLLVPQEVSLHLVHRYAHTWPAVIELIASGRVPTDNLVTHHFGLDQSAQAFETQRSDPTAVKVMIHPHISAFTAQGV